MMKVVAFLSFQFHVLISFNVFQFHLLDGYEEFRALKLQVLIVDV